MKERILVTGGSGVVGKHLKNLGFSATYLSSKECDLRNYNDVQNLFDVIRPTIVIHLAAKVGGILDNIKNPVGFFEDNILMNTNVVKCAHEFNCNRLVGILSTCIYPDRLPDELYPLQEERLHEGPPTATNFSYGYAKRSLAVQIQCYREQYGRMYSSLIPCNLYSEYEDYEISKMHFLGSLLKKIAHAKIKNQSHIELYGTGSPIRQFMYAEDLARAIIDYVSGNHICDLNVATPEIYTIKQIAEIALEACKANELKIIWDTTKPDGQYRKDVSIQKFNELFPKFEYTSLRAGIIKSFNSYIYEMESKRV